ncbi:MAG: MarR family winged helix-turn-helix transcriptional regulator [Anaerolineaceae bacterium]|jgi:DNA-binding MarR family transcriptional regulator
MAEDVKKQLHDWADQATRHSIRAMQAYNQEHNYSFSQTNTLFFLHREPGTGINDLARHLGITTAAVSQMLDKLVETQLVDRREDPQDRRAKTLSLTAQGQEVVQQIKSVRHEWIDSFLDTFSPQEKAAVLPALILMNQKLSLFNQTQRAKEKFN